MVEPSQILLFTVVTVLTVLMVIIGWQIFQILSEIKKMLQKANTMADGAIRMTSRIGKSFENLSGFSEGLKSVFKIFTIFKKDKKNE